MAEIVCMNLSPGQKIAGPCGSHFLIADSSQAL
jgi:hypothetical protein